LRIIGIRGIIHYSRQVCNLLFLAFQYSSPGGSTTAGEVCYLRLPCCVLRCQDFTHVDTAAVKAQA